jgi:hypothetical protein
MYQNVSAMAIASATRPLTPSPQALSNVFRGDRFPWQRKNR